MLGGCDFHFAGQSDLRLSNANLLLFSTYCPITLATGRQTGFENGRCGAPVARSKAAQSSCFPPSIYPEKSKILDIS